MKVQVQVNSGITIIGCAGEVDLYSSPRLREALVKEMQAGVGSLLVNMTDVSYIDSSGIATLVEGLQLSKQTRTRFGLFGLRKNARSVLKLARLDQVFIIFENEQEAIQKISSTQPWAGL